MDVKDIERSIIKTFKSKIYAKFLRAIKEYSLVEDGDSICVCISGGKDSFVMAKCFQELKRHSKFQFDVKFVVMNPGYRKEHLDKIKNNLKLLNIEAEIFESNIFEDIKSYDSICYFCARKRRGFLYAKAKELGCNKIALGHHFDDVIETILLNILYAGEYKTMMPKLKSTNFEGMELIRPMYFIKEKDIIAWKNHCNLTFLNCACTVVKEKMGKRREVKELIESFRKIDKNIDIHIFKSSENINIDAVLGYKDSTGFHSFLDEYND